MFTVPYTVHEDFFSLNPLVSTIVQIFSFEGFG